jgi:hypothetical protein
MDEDPFSHFEPVASDPIPDQLSFPSEIVGPYTPVHFGPTSTASSSTSSAATAVISANTSAANHFDDEDFGDFDAATTATAAAPPLPMAAISPSSISAPISQQSGPSFSSSSSSYNIDLFAISPTSSSSTSSAAPFFFGSSSVTVGQLTPPLSPDQLEHLAGLLEPKALYEEAHLCLQRADAMRELEALNQAKRAAVDADDLVEAVRLKGDISRVSGEIARYSVESEGKWVAAATTGSNGETLEELVELVQMLNPELGAVYKKRFVEGAPVATHALRHRVKFALLAKRCIRLGTAISTTHTSLPASWLRLLTAVANTLSEAAKSVEAFSRLSAEDQKAVRASEKMRAFVDGAQAVAEAGVWVAASCLEALVHDELAGRVVRQCTSFCASTSAAQLVGNKEGVNSCGCCRHLCYILITFCISANF